MLMASCSWGSKGWPTGSTQLDAELLEGGAQQAQGRLLAGQEALGRGGRRPVSRPISRLSTIPSSSPGQLLHAGTAGRLDVAGCALADVVQLRHGPEVAVPVLGGRGLGLLQRLAQLRDGIRRTGLRGAAPAAGASGVSGCSVSGIGQAPSGRADTGGPPPATGRNGGQEPEFKLEFRLAFSAEPTSRAVTSTIGITRS